MPSCKRILLCYLALAAMGLLVYGPALGGGFLWDDSDWIRDNETLRSWSGLWRIWFEPGAVIQYYPLTYTSWWLDCQLWGLSPTVMHVENVLLHAANALLFGLLLRRLSAPGAAFAAVVFLLHPVHSESVAWLVERKNTLSGAFYLGACHLWLSHLAKPSATTLIRTLLVYLLALLAKTATLMLPVTLFAIAVWRMRHEDRAREWRVVIRRLLPFAAMTVIAALVTVVMERGEGAAGHDWALSGCERVALLGQVVGFYLGQLIAPWGLSFSYAKWDIGAHSVLGCLPTIVLLVALMASAFAIARSFKPVAVACSLALCVFVANLLPVSGLVDYYYLRYAFAADHFQYLSSLGPIALVCCGGAFVMQKLRARVVVAVALAMLLAVGAWRRAGIFTDLETLWRATIEAEPDAWLAHTNLGNLLSSRGDPDAGIGHHRRAVMAYADAFESNNAIGNYHVRRGEFAQARACFDRALKVRPHDALTYNNLGTMFGVQGDYRAALRYFARGHEAAPGNRDLLRNLAVVLSQAPDVLVRDGGRALRLAKTLNRVATPSLADEHVLFRATLIGGDRNEAIALGERVLRRAQLEGNPVLAQRVDAQLRRLKRGP